MTSILAALAGLGLLWGASVLVALWLTDRSIRVPPGDRP